MGDYCEATSTNLLVFFGAMIKMKIIPVQTHVNEGPMPQWWKFLLNTILAVLTNEYGQKYQKTKRACVINSIKTQKTKNPLGNKQILRQ